MLPPSKCFWTGDGFVAFQPCWPVGLTLSIGFPISVLHLIIAPKWPVIELRALWDRQTETDGLQSATVFMSITAYHTWRRNKLKQSIYSTTIVAHRRLLPSHGRTDPHYVMSLTVGAFDIPGHVTTCQTHRPSLVHQKRHHTLPFIIVVFLSSIAGHWRKVCFFPPNGRHFIMDDRSDLFLWPRQPIPGKIAYTNFICCVIVLKRIIEISQCWRTRQYRQYAKHQPRHARSKNDTRLKRAAGERVETCVWGCVLRWAGIVRRRCYVMLVWRHHWQ